MSSPRDIISALLAGDKFSNWLGVEIVEVTEDSASLRMTVRDEMTNGFGTAHGGIVYAFADSTFAFVTNSDGELSVALDTSMSYPAAIHVGDVLVSSGKRVASTNRTAFAEVTVRNQNDVIVGLFRGTVYRTHKQLPGLK